MSSSDDNDSQSNIYEQGRQRSGRWRRSRRLNSLISSTPPKDFMTLNFRPHSKPVPHRPRFLLAGDEGLGQSTHFAPAVLHSMEHLKVHVLDLPALFGVSSRVPEEACAQVRHHRSYPKYVLKICPLTLKDLGNLSNISSRKVNKNASETFTLTFCEKKFLGEHQTIVHCFLKISYFFYCSSSCFLENFRGGGQQCLG